MIISCCRLLSSNTLLIPSCFLRVLLQKCMAYLNNLAFAGSCYPASTRAGWSGVRGPNVVDLEIRRGWCRYCRCHSYPIDRSPDADATGRASAGSLLGWCMDGQINRSLIQSSCACFIFTREIMCIKI